MLALAGSEKNNWCLCVPGLFCSGNTKTLPNSALSKSATAYRSGYSLPSRLARRTTSRRVARQKRGETQAPSGARSTSRSRAAGQQHHASHQSGPRARDSRGHNNLPAPSRPPGSWLCCSSRSRLPECSGIVSAAASRRRLRLPLLPPIQ
jgi:hypothetical protein